MPETAAQQQPAHQSEANQDEPQKNVVDATKYQEVLEELTRVKEHHEKLLGETKEAKRKAREIEEQRQKEADELARKNGDIEALEQSWTKKYETTMAELKQQYEPKLAEYERLINDVTAGASAAKIAAEIAVPGSAPALEQLIRPRLGSAIKNGKAVTVVLDENGKPSAQTLSELKEEFLNNAAVAPLIVGSRATGGGASESNGGAGPNTIKRAEFDKKSPDEKAAFVRNGGKISD